VPIVTRDIERIRADPRQPPAIRRLAGRCLELCLRAEAANTSESRDALLEEVRTLLALITWALSEMKKPPGAA
jgi:hypothetical protein